MSKTRILRVALCLLALDANTKAGQAATMVPSRVPPVSNETTAAFARTIRSYLLRELPEPLYDASPGWGREVRTWRGTKKDGLWRKIHVTALNPAHTLTFDIRDVSLRETGRIGFTALFALEARVEHRWQRWAAGVKLYNTSIRARFRVQVTLQCEATIDVGHDPLLLPEAVCRLRATESHLQLDNVVVEHVAGFGGDAAEIVGNTIRRGLKQWHPSLERRLLTKAEAAIVRAVDTKEVRLSLTRLWQKPKT